MLYKVHKQYRLPNYSYSNAGYYYVTICSQDKKLLFGMVVGESVELSEIGKIAQKYWQEIPNHFDNVELDEFIIMPNHLHGIIVILNNKNICRNGQLSVPDNALNGQLTVPTIWYKNGQLTVPTLQPQKNSLSIIIRTYKGAVKKWCNDNGYPYFAWQSRFYDHIIRDDKALDQIRHYIKFNVFKWGIDENNPKNLKS